MYSMEIMKCQRYGMIALRITLGWYFLYAGFSKIINPDWSAAGYLNTAKTFTGFYAWLASPSMIDVVNFFNEWALLIIGLSVLLGIFVKWTAPVGAVMMILYYFPILTFPTAGHGFIVDEHLIYAAALMLLAAYHKENPEWFKKLFKK